MVRSSNSSSNSNSSRSDNNNHFVDDDRFDGLYLNVAQQAHGIEPLLDTLFSFLRRKTDFFAGPPSSSSSSSSSSLSSSAKDSTFSNSNTTQRAVDKVNEVLQKHVHIYQDDCNKKAKASAAAAAAKEKALKAKNATQTAVQERQKQQPDQQVADILEMSTDGGFDTTTTETSSSTPLPPSPSSTPTPTPSTPSQTHEIAEENPKNSESSSSSDHDQTTTKTTPPQRSRPIGNGGSCSLYTWTQTLGEVIVSMPVPDGTRGKDLKVVLHPRHLTVELFGRPATPKKQQIVVDAPLTHPIIVDESFWTVEDANRLVLNLQKINQMEWWAGVCDGLDDTINVQDIQPENSSLSDLDGDTRQTVEKMMYDQRQKALGLPTSEEANKLAMLEKFKNAHPELDFSQAKFS